MRHVAVVWVVGALLTSAGARAQVPAKKLYGYYVGSFIATEENVQKKPMFVNKINISVDSIKGGKIKGHSVVAGNYRPFSGTISDEGESYAVVAREPGDDKYDGVFNFVIDPKQHTLSGYWTANDRKLAVTKRMYRLDKRKFSYNPRQVLKFRDRGQRGSRASVYDTYDQATDTSEVITAESCRINASSTPLSSSDVENMYKSDLEIMRNTIYARHGYSFQNRAMRVFFDAVDWYIPVSIDVTNELTELEKRNIEILKRYEQHANTYYDRFGR